MRVGNIRKPSDVQNVQCRICNGFTEYQAGFIVEQSVNFFVFHIRRNKAHFNAHTFHGYGKQIYSTAVNCRAGYKILPCAGNIQNGEKRRRLSR
ncbi:hypothetical protein IMSAG013_00876 [Clostridiales bacterium]|nr:hypothetical protein IMSAG013_00876 [Clostridiales bacterium]